MPKRDSIISVKLTDSEALNIRKEAASLDMDVSELIRACITVGLPTIHHVPFIRRVRLEDSSFFKE